MSDYQERIGAKRLNKRKCSFVAKAALVSRLTLFILPILALNAATINIGTPIQMLLVAFLSSLFSLLWGAYSYQRYCRSKKIFELE